MKIKKIKEPMHLQTNATQNKKPVEITDEISRVTQFVSLLMQIDKRNKLKNKTS